MIAREQLAAALADRYRIERELGQGGMATVYLAEDLKHRRKVAVKVLRPELAAALGPERFLREIETTAALHHPHILALYDSGKSAGFLYYVMPYVEGESLRDRLTREKQLPLDDALQIAREVADALSYAHSRGVVHRDIKPENILLESGHALVADFGIAKAVSAAGGESLTQTGIAVGTPSYMSPEQAAGEKDLDGRSDLYALGCVLYEMLAGQAPFTGPTVESIVHQHLAVVPPPVTNLRPAVPAAVAAALQRALAKPPADRFNSVALFADALTRDVGAVGAGDGEDVLMVQPRRWWWSVAAGLALVVVVVSVGWWRSAHGTTAESASVAVLPFVDLSPERTNTYLGDGIAETLINALANVEGLSVAARTSAFSFRDQAEDVREIGRRLGVATVLEGSVQRAGDRLRVTAQLIKTEDGLHLWSQNFDRSAADIFAVQDEVARAVATALQGRLVAPSMTAGGTHDPAAYDAYLLGRFHWNRRTADDLVRAAEQFGHAIRLDSSYAQAWSGLADSYVLFIPAEYDVPGIDPDSILDLAERSARRAIALAPDLGEPYTSLGEILEYRGRWKEARDAFERGVALSPNYATGHQWYAYDLMVWNQWDAAIREMERARELDPLSMIITVSLAAVYDGAERWDEAHAAYEQAGALAPDHPLVLLAVGVHDLLHGDWGAFAVHWPRYLVVTGGDSAAAQALARRLEHQAGRTTALREIARARDTHPIVQIAIARVLDGDEGAIARLAAMVGHPDRERTNPAMLFDFLGPRLRADPRAQAVLAQLGWWPER